MVNGIAQRPIEGVSMAYTFDKANANAPSTHKTQYFEMMGLDLPVPSYSQISRRAKSLHRHINRLVKDKKARHVIFDSTGLKVYGEGE